MYLQPALFPAISNRESWVQTIQIADDQTGDLIALTNDSGAPLYAVYLEISASRNSGARGSSAWDWYDECGSPAITATLDDYIAITGVGSLEINIPYTVIQTLHGRRTYDVYLRITDAANGDARQLLIGRLPVAYGGRSS